MLTVLHLTALWEKTRPVPKRPLWALGDPIYRPDDPRLTTRPESERAMPAQTAEPGIGPYGGTFNRLPASGVEVNRLRGLMGAGASDVLLGTDATEAQRTMIEAGEPPLFRAPFILIGR